MATLLSLSVSPVEIAACKKKDSRLQSGPLRRDIFGYVTSRNVTSRRPYPFRPLRDVTHPLRGVTVSRSRMDLPLPGSLPLIHLTSRECAAWGR